jgi:arylsulfatase A-like enzyme
MLGEHDYMDKRWMYDESMRMPFIVRNPFVKERGVRTKALVNNVDYAPTIITMGGGNVPTYMQGKSFKDVIKTPTLSFNNSLYYRYWMHLTHHDIPAHFGVRTETSKLIFYYCEHYLPELYGKNTFPWAKNPSESYHFEPTPVAWEFYDLTIDPTESVNRYKDKAYANKIADLKKELIDLRIKYKETDEKYPNIQQAIDTHWND